MHNNCRYEIDIKLMERRRFLNLMSRDEEVFKKKMKLAEKNIACVAKNIDSFFVII